MDFTNSYGGQVGIRELSNRRHKAIGMNGILSNFSINSGFPDNPFWPLDDLDEVLRDTRGTSPGTYEGFNSPPHTSVYSPIGNNVWEIVGGGSQQFTLSSGLIAQTTNQAHNPNDYIDAGFTGAAGRGYNLVNKIITAKQIGEAPIGSVDLMQCGAGTAQDGALLAMDGASSGGFTGGTGFSTVYERRVYPISTDSDTFGYWYYVGGQNFPDIVTLPAERRDEFEDLLLEIAPAHLWAGLLINYTAPNDNAIAGLAIAGIAKAGKGRFTQ